MENYILGFFDADGSIPLSKHPKKFHRANTIVKYYKISTVRNGKYNKKQESRKYAMERLFHMTLKVSL